MDYLYESRHDEEITKVKYFKTDDSENWIYSMQKDGDTLIKYYIMTMSLSDNKPMISDLNNPISKLSNIDAIEIRADDQQTAPEYLRFMSIKKIAEINSINRIRAYYDKLNDINKKR